MNLTYRIPSTVFSHHRGCPSQVANRGKWSQVSQARDAGLGEREEAQYPTLAEASAIPRAAQQAPCRAGSLELLQRAGSCEASSEKIPLISLAAEGSHFLHPRMPAPGGPQRSWSPTPLDRGTNKARRGTGPAQGHTGRWWASRGHCPSSNAGPEPPTPPRSSYFPPLSGKPAGRVCSFGSLCCGGSISCQS